MEATLRPAAATGASPGKPAGMQRCVAAAPQPSPGEPGPADDEDERADRPAPVPPSVARPRAPAGKVTECPKSVTGKHVFAKDWNPLLCAALSLIFFPGAVCYCVAVSAVSMRPPVHYTAGREERRKD